MPSCGVDEVAVETWTAVAISLLTGTFLVREGRLSDGVEVNGTALDKGELDERDVEERDDEGGKDEGAELEELILIGLLDDLQRIFRWNWCLRLDATVLLYSFNSVL